MEIEVPCTLSLDNPRVVLAEEHPTLRAAVKSVLEADGFVVCGEAENAEEGQRVVLRERPDVCLVGLRPEGSLQMIARITDERDGPGTIVIVLTASRSTESMIAAIRAGATGYLLKEMNPARIPAAVRGVLNGEAAMPRTLVVRLIREIQRLGRGPMLSGRGGLVELTSRQWDVLNLMSDRLSTAEIAERLLISPVTVRRHTSAILEKLGVADRESAVALLSDSR
jgi:DNA-binding NarL/FixJ family response regulator